MCDGEAGPADRVRVGVRVGDASAGDADAARDTDAVRVGVVLAEVTSDVDAVRDARDADALFDGVREPDAASDFVGVPLTVRVCDAADLVRLIVRVELGVNEGVRDRVPVGDAAPLVVAVRVTEAPLDGVAVAVRDGDCFEGVRVRVTEAEADLDLDAVELAVVATDVTGLVVPQPGTLYAAWQPAPQ